MNSGTIAIVCGVLCFCTAVKYKNIMHPLFLFNIIWCLILILESFQLYGLNDTDGRIYKYMLGGILSFNICYEGWFEFRKRYKIKWHPIFKAKAPVSLRRDLIYVMVVICFAYYMISVIETIGTLVSGGTLAVVRESVQNAESSTAFVSKVLNAFSVLIIVPFAQAIPVACVVNYWYGDKDKKLLFVGAMLSVLSSLGEGGRTAIVNFGFYMILCLSLRKTVKKTQRRRLSRRQKRIVAFSAILLGLLIVWFTVSRSGELLWKNLYLYFSMEPYMFNAWADRVDTLDLYGFGEASLNGFCFAPLYLVKNILGIDFPTHWKVIYELIRLTDSEWMTITAQLTRANAYVSAFWFFYLDGRVVGIIVGFALYGIFLAGCHQNAIKNGNMKQIAVFCFGIQGLIWTFIRFPFSNIYYCIAFIYLYFLIFESKLKRS